MDTLFYDGQCPLCAREIRLLRRWNDGGLAFADIHALPDRELPAAVSRESLLRRLHVHTHDGVWHIGLDATVRSWSHTRWGFLVRPLRWRAIRPLAERIYRRWADRRFCRRYGQTMRCGSPEGCAVGRQSSH